MKKKKKKVALAVAILVAVVAIGIGYAITAINLTVTGTANATASNEFKVAFDGVTTGSTGTATAAAQAETGTCTVTLDTVGQSQTCNFEVMNYSPEGINASLVASNLNVYSDSSYNTAWTNSSSQYFTVTVTPGWSGTKTLIPGETTTFTVTVTLKKAWIGDSAHTENFYVKLADITAVQA
ncbi:MAG: hypothetical protein J6X28_01135 [Bacilli bacterium]|nr:hypothetical protein [Bacilli bacterium]